MKKPFIFDEILENISKDLECQILLGYYQSTSGHGRFAEFAKGHLNLSVVQKSVKFEIWNELILTESFGADNFFSETFSIPKVREKYSELDVDEIYRMFKYYGLDKFNDIEVERYYHLEKMEK